MTAEKSQTNITVGKREVKQVVKNKGGAPRKTIRRASGIRVRLTTSERFLIESKARKAGVNLSDWIRACALKGNVISRMSAEDRRILHTMSGMANNLNQMTKLAHTGGIIGIAIRCDSLLKEIDHTLKTLNGHDG